MKRDWKKQTTLAVDFIKLAKVCSTVSAYGIVTGVGTGCSLVCAAFTYLMAGLSGPLAWATYASALITAASCKTLLKLRPLIQDTFISKAKSATADLQVDDFCDSLQNATPFLRKTALASAVALACTWNLAAHVRDTLDAEAPKAQTVSGQHAPADRSPSRALESFGQKTSFTAPQPRVIVVNQGRNRSGQFVSLS